MAKIEVISSCVVGMESNNPNPMSRMELTPWDLQLLLINPIQRGILFHKPESKDIDQNLIDHLKNSLSRTLDSFPPLAGRLATTENDDSRASFSVDCNNAGVEFVHAVAAAVSISDILEPTYIPEIVYSFFPLNETSNSDDISKPLLAVQATELVDGLFIACTANHAIVDGTSFWHFFNSWSEMSRGFDTVSKIPVFERWLSPNAAGGNPLIRLPPLEKNLLRNFVGPPLLKRAFHFNKQSLAKLKAKANGEAATDKISTLQALSAHLWRSATRSRHSKCTGNLSSQEVRFKLLVGARSRIPLPDGYFGNAVYVDTIAISPSELLQKGLGYSALKINELVAQQTNEAATKFFVDWVKNPTLWKRGSFAFVVTSSPRHNVYGNDFGWGEPMAERPKLPL